MLTSKFAWMRFKKLYFLGQASSPNAELVGLYAKEVANKAWEIAAGSNIKPTNQNPLASTPSGHSGTRSYSTSATSNMADAGKRFFFHDVPVCDQF